MVRALGGSSKVKDLLQVMKDNDVNVDTLLAYLKSVGFKVPSTIEIKIEKLERRISILEGKPQLPTVLSPVKVSDKYKAKREVKRRAKKGEITPQAHYTFPILGALIEMGGSGRVSKVLDRVFNKMKDRLKPKDLEKLSSGISVRWKNKAQWERQRLKSEGYLKKDSPRGIWEITDKGRNLYESLKERDFL